MTKQLSGEALAKQIEEKLPESISFADDSTIIIDARHVLKIAKYLNETPELDFDYLNCLSGVDYFDYLEVVYHLTSLGHNHSLVLKARCYDTESPSIPSVTGIWKGADFQEREVFDLLGISFPGHPNLKRIVLWDGFQGHPLRKDFL